MEAATETEVPKPQSQAAPPPRLRERYEHEIVPELVKRFSYGSRMQAPRVEKITLNMGVGEARDDVKLLDAAAEQLGVITGQRPSVRRAR